MSKKKLRKLKRAKPTPKGRNHHHLTPKSRGGEHSPSNLLLIKEERHNLWHQLWGNRTLDEILDLLTRMARAKNHQK